jgi:hypothetical protein
MKCQEYAVRVLDMASTDNVRKEWIVRTVVHSRARRKFQKKLKMYIIISLIMSAYVLNTVNYVHGFNHLTN